MGERVEVPELVVVGRDGDVSAVWYPNLRMVTVTAGDQEITLSAGDIRALSAWVNVNELQ